MLVKEVMNKNVVTTGPETTIRETAKIMADNRIGCVIIELNGKVTGIATDRDILTAFARNEDPEFGNYKISEVMTRYVIPISPDSKIEKAVNIMTEHKIKKLPVVDNEKLVGIVTLSDIAVVEPKIIESIGNLLSKNFKNI